MTEQQCYPIDPTNPGEVLACAALAWLATREDPQSESGFTQTGDGGSWQFQGPWPEASVHALIEQNPREQDDAVWIGGLRLDWFQYPYGLNPGFKFWAGQQTATTVLTNLVQAAREGDPQEWLSYRAPTTGRLGVDPEGTWDSLALGWSVNEHTRLKYLCRPFVEMLAFVGLQRFPVQGSRAEGFRYHLWRPAPGTLAPIALAGASSFSVGGWQTEIADSGSNKYLKPARVIRE